MSDCLFCKIINKKIPADIIYEDNKVLVFNDIDKKAPEHFLVIPKKHVATLNDIDDANLLGYMQLTAIKIAKDLGLAADGYRLVMNCNADAGQSVFHIHLHCLGGRSLSWPPG